MDRNLLEAMIQQLDGYKGELQAIRVYEEINYVVPILGRLVESLQAEAWELLGNSAESVKRRRIALAPGQNFKPLLVSADETFTPLGVLLGGWIFLEIYNTGFFQGLDDRRDHVGPRFLELDLDPTTSPPDYALRLHPNRPGAHQLSLHRTHESTQR